MRTAGHSRWPVTLALLLVVTGASFAQVGVQPAWISITKTRIKPASKARYERSLRRMVAAYKQAGIPWLVTLQTFAGETTEYTVIAPWMKFADLAPPTAPARTLGQKKWNSLASEMARCYTSQTVQFATPLAALAIGKEGAAAGSYWVETTSQPVAGKTTEYLDWLRDEYRPALQKTGVPGFRVFMDVFGSTGGEIVSVRMLKNLGEIDQGSILTAALGADQSQKVSAEGSKLVRETSTKILYVRKDLSYFQATKTGKVLSAQ